MLSETIHVSADELNRVNTLLEKGRAFYNGEDVDSETEQQLRDIEGGTPLAIKRGGKYYDALDVRFDDGLIGDVRVCGGRSPYVTFTLFEEVGDNTLNEVATHGSVREQLDTEWTLEHDGTTYHLSIEPEEA